MKVAVSGWIIGLTMLSSASAANGEASLSCDRSCLEGLLSSYLFAMVAHDPAQVPLAEGARFTENTVELDFDNGLWTTATGVGDYRITAVDPATGQIAYAGVVHEHGRPVLLSLRIRAEGRRIAEAESVVARSVRHFRNLQTPRPGMLQSLDPADRSSRAAMLAQVDGYFDGMVESNSRLVAFTSDCDRLENGLQTTNNPGLAAELAEASGGAAAPAIQPLISRQEAPVTAPAPGGSGALSSGCSAQFDTGAFGFISSVEPRRGLVVDEEKGIAFGLFRFNHRGLSPEIRLKNGNTMPDPFGGQPWSMQIAEFFKFRDGRIWLIEAIGTPLPYGAPTGWEK